MRGALARLRWQLTLSHLIAIVVTLVSMVAALILIAGSWIAVQTGPDREAANDARIVARSIGPLVEAGGERDALNVILQALAQGKVRAQIGPGPFAPEPAYRIEGIGPSLRGLGYVAIVGPDDRVIASSDPSGSAFDPPERAEWAPIVAAARSGERNTARLTVRREGAGPLALGAYPIGGAVVDGPPWLRGGPDQATAVVVVAKTEISEPSPFRAIVRGIAIFTAATIAVLGSAFLFALGSAALVGYVLSRQLVRRLERLSGAVEALANGDLGRRVEEGRDDEVGQLSRRFNVMADRLATTVAELDARTREAEAALAAKRELVANVSHELRTPLASISGHAESLLLLGEGASPERREESLTVLHREARQLSRLVDDLFLLSTTESGGLPLAIREVDVGGVLEEVAANVPAAGSARGTGRARLGRRGGAAVGAGRPRADRPGARQPGPERAAPHPRGRDHLAAGGQGGRRDPRDGGGHRRRHLARSDRADLRAVLPRRRGEGPGERRGRPGAGDRARAGGGDGRQRGRRERRRRGQPVLVHAPGRGCGRRSGPEG